MCMIISDEQKRDSHIEFVCQKAALVFAALVETKFNHEKSFASLNEARKMICDGIASCEEWDNNKKVSMEDKKIRCRAQLPKNYFGLYYVYQDKNFLSTLKKIISNIDLFLQEKPTTYNELASSLTHFFHKHAQRIRHKYMPKNTGCF